ncbi:MAG: D-alanyl-D-alanine carboxypeptidase family protein [Clostridia bacterium]|nr:D-alanyl-D-alanine carboxypeptidase family protein [Clostridia bacterium]
MKKLKIIFCTLLATIFIVPFNIFAATVSSECDISDINIPIDATVTDAAIGTKLDIKAKSAILMEKNSGKILYEMNADQKMPPASITKIMSLLLVMEAIDQNKIKLEDVITASEHACSMGGSQIWLEAGEPMTVDDLLKAAVIASANDATVVLGEHIAGSEEGFVAMMNEKAAALGMTNTNFVNATGLDAEGHVSTAHDIAIMSAELLKHDLIKNYSTIWMDTLRDGKSELVNTNKLVRFYEGTTGLKTGTTSGAGYCLAASAERGGLELVAVIMAGDTSADRFNGAKKLLDYGFANYEYTTVAPKLKTQELSVKNGVEQTAPIKASSSFGALLKKSESAAITQKLNLPENIVAPVKAGDKIGTVDFYLGDSQIGSVDVVSTADIEKMSFLTAFLWVFNGLFH